MNPAQNPMLPGGIPVFGLEKTVKRDFSLETVLDSAKKALGEELHERLQKNPTFEELVKIGALSAEALPSVPPMVWQMVLGYCILQIIQKESDFLDQTKMNLFTIQSKIFQGMVHPAMITLPTRAREDLATELRAYTQILCPWVHEAGRDRRFAGDSGTRARLVFFLAISDTSRALNKSEDSPSENYQLAVDLLRGPVRAA